MSLQRKDDIDVKELARAVAINTAGAGIGAGAGYGLTALVATPVLKSERFKDYYDSISPGRREWLKNGIRGTGASLGLIGGLAGSQLMHRALEKGDEEKNASRFFTRYAYDRLL